MTLKQLEAFYWAATCKNFAIAANRLNISVSSLSKRIGELEASIGADLFSRSARSATLTALGEQLVPHAKDLLRNADQFMQQASNNLTYSGRCRFGAGELTSMTWMPRLIDDIQRAYPNLLVEPFVGVGELVERGLEEGELDFAVIAGPSSRASIASHLIGSAAFEWVAAPRAVPDPAALTPADLPGLTLITQPPSSGVIRMLDDWLTEQGVSPGRTQCCNSWGAIAGMLRHGLGLGFLPTSWARALIQRGDLQALPGLPPLRPLPYTFQWRRDDTRPMLADLRVLAQSAQDFGVPAGML
ncbi:LysR family transcriptional regulator [Achromobacter piechaudii]|uniref:HTH-type transcriptional regulator GltR n=1 Tax=Achromobacter piechaudii TaxID=72556 RepID=A0A6S7D8A1_9BURK|nr:LysR family transcriptional regulator [Achromobacter piechaudii]KNY10175.1 LysR family transcriptional regulator [Achromobacter piechaudii]CAB3681755.1 HTH-type transcriptional regulator GltR [Achromobacter piechaudii]CAB3864557.1 HTH-type transcriptional regulator GltR [Achromobacter piechaudii]CAB3871223.1 HTH-type transcriptional regulator GltR [Achromobacter piechaudii]CAB3947875.1 HTH-type transcriptional regulator GltR [Achromobacter piechaudii]